MAFTTQQLAERLLKKSQGVADTKYPLSQRGITEEGVGTYNLVRPNDIWTDAENIPTTPPVLVSGATSGVVKYYEKLRLEAVDGGTTVSFKSPSGETIDIVTGKFAFGYIPKIYDTTGNIQIFKGSPVIDVETGIITFYDINESGIEAVINPANPPRISFYKYIGGKGVGAVGSFLPITGGVLTGGLTGTTFVKSGGTSTQFLKADGSVDSNTYLTQTGATNIYIPYTGATSAVNLGANTFKTTGYLAFGDLGVLGSLVSFTGTSQETTSIPTLNVNSTVSGAANPRQPAIVGRLLIAGSPTTTQNSIQSFIDVPSGNTGNISASMRSTSSIMTHNGTGTITSGIGAWNSVANVGTGTLTTGYAAYNTTTNAATSFMTNAYGSYNSITNNSVNPMTIAYANYGIIANSGGGNIQYGASVFGQITNSAASTMSNMYGMYSSTNQTSSGDVGTMHGLWNALNVSGTGNVTTVYATKFSLTHSNTSNITNYVGISASLSKTGSGVISNVYGISIGGPNDLWSKTNGIVDNSYGLYLGSSIDVGTTKYAIYSESNSNSYFKGKVSIGTTGSTEMLEVSGYTLSTGFKTPSGTTSQHLTASGSVVKKYNEVVTQNIDGINKIFTLSRVFISGSVVVYLNGIREIHSIELGNNQIEFEDAPQSIGFVDLVEVEYMSVE